MMRADRKKVEPLVKTARGQIEAVLKMIDDDRYCIDIINQLAATEALLRKARKEVLKGHLNGCVRDAGHSPLSCHRRFPDDFAMYLF